MAENIPNLITGGKKAPRSKKFNISKYKKTNKQKKQEEVTSNCLKPLGKKKILKSAKEKMIKITTHIRNNVNYKIKEQHLLNM